MQRFGVDTGGGEADARSSGPDVRGDGARSCSALPHYMRPCRGARQPQMMALQDNTLSKAMGKEYRKIDEPIF